MQQLELITIETPCINVCQSDNRGYCLGCFRSRDERFKWAQMTSPEKRKVLELCKSRNKRRIAKEKAKEKAKQNAQPNKNQSDTQSTEPQVAATTDTTTKAASSKNNQQPAKQDDSTCVAKTNQSVQDMGLDLFDL